MGAFSASVNAWAASAKDKSEAVFQTAVQMLEQEVKKPLAEGGNMPIDTGNLRRSLVVSNKAMPTVKTGVEEFKDSSVDNALTITNTPLGSVIYMGFQAAYARRQNYGFTGTDSLGREYNQAGKQFVGLAAQRWQQIVAAANFKVQKAYQSRQAGGARGTVARQDRSSR